MLSKEIVKLINEQINKELFSAYLYLDMAGYYADESLTGFENWFYVQAQEERDHAMLFRQYLLNNDDEVVLTAIDAPESNYADFKAPLLQTLDHEKTVTASINNIYAAAYSEKDFRTMQLLDWFVKEQGEEEKNSMDLIKKYELFGGDSKGLYMLNQELSARIYSPASLIL
jgi:ferritin